MEALGLAIGVVGVVPVVFQGYQRCFDLINCARNLSSNVRKAGEKLHIQRKIFDRECRLLLKYVVSQEVAEEMIGDHLHEMWSSEDFESGLARALGTDFEIHFKHIKASLDAIERLLKDGTGNKQNQAGRSTKEWSLSTFRKLRYVLTGRESLLQLIDILRQQNLDLFHSRQQQAKLANSQQTAIPRSQTQKQSRSMISPHPFRNVQTISKVLYEGLSATDMCTCHVLNLQLDGILPEFKDTHAMTCAGAAEKSFQFVVAKKLQTGTGATVWEKCPVECTQLIVRSAAQSTTDDTVIKVPGSQVKGKGGIRFAIDEPDAPLHPQRGPPKPMPPSQAHIHAIRSLCALIAQPSYSFKPADPLGIIQGVEERTSAVKYKHYVYSDTTTAPVTFQTSLSELLQEITQTERLRLAIALAQSLLSFGSYETSWFRERWRTKDIVFFVNEIPESSTTLNPCISPFFPSQGKGKAIADYTNVQTQGWARNEHLFSLALVLTEIGLRKKIPNSNAATGRPTIDTLFAEYVDAKSVVESDALKLEMGPKYAKIVKKCFHCDFGTGEGDFSNEELQGNFYRDVVCELENCYRVFTGDLNT